MAVNRAYMVFHYHCTNQDCENYNKHFRTGETGSFICPICKQPLTFEHPEEPTTGNGTFAGMIVGGAIWLAGGPIGEIIGGGIRRLFNFFWGLGLWRRRLTTGDTEGTESCCFLRVLCALCGFPISFQKIIKSLCIRDCIR